MLENQIEALKDNYYCVAYDVARPAKAPMAMGNTQ
jgi:hypothetical protein